MLDVGVASVTAIYLSLPFCIKWHLSNYTLSGNTDPNIIARYYCGHTFSSHSIWTDSYWLVTSPNRIKIFDRATDGQTIVRVLWHKIRIAETLDLSTLRVTGVRVTVNCGVLAGLG